MIRFPLPLLGFAAFSGTGKTTLLSALIPLLQQEGTRIGVIKHAHHDFEIDHPGKDSHRLRQAGACQMLIASRDRVAWIKETPGRQKEPTLSQVLSMLDPSHLDLVLVEGFKRESFPKIELHRPIQGRPLLYPNDPDIIAVATDTPLFSSATDLPRLDLNQPQEIATFVQRFIDAHSGSHTGWNSRIHIL
jgi:molybdopterin-guanine dinucleotide biosynthesis protein B